MIDLEEAKALFEWLDDTAVPDAIKKQRFRKIASLGLTLCVENKKLRELVGAQREYIELLGKELEQTASIAFTHGWRSMEFGRGEELRTKIAELEKEMGCLG